MDYPMASKHVRPEILPITTTFTVGAHTVRVSRSTKGRWTATVDGGPPTDSSDTQVEAWEAGVREAYRLDAKIG
jgi:hypothetical protein